MTTDKRIDNNHIDPQLAFEIRRALLEDADMPDAQKAFLKFKSEQLKDDCNRQQNLSNDDRKQKKHTYRQRIFYSATLLAAACITALFIFLTDKDVHPSTTQRVPGLLVYNAQSQASSEITISSGGQQVNIGSTQANKQGFTFNANNVIAVQRTKDTEMNTETTLWIPKGKVAKVILEDGTHVWLSANSQLQFPHNFSPNIPRTVKLYGEAYFEVTHDERRPFIVDCGQFETTVLGTEFNVRNIHGLQPEVALVSGSIQIGSHGKQRVLAPNEGATITQNGELNVHEIDPDVVTCWKDGEFYFDGQSLREIMTEIGRWYNMDVVFSNNKHQYDQLHFNGERDWNISETIHQLQLITTADIQIIENTIVVK